MFYVRGFFFLMLLCFLPEKFKFFKIQSAQEFRARFH